MIRPLMKHGVLFSGFLCVMLAAGHWAEPQKLELQRNDMTGQLRVLIDGRETMVYQYAQTLDLPHYWPVNSPSGKNMLVQQTEPYPHHRSFWFADTVRLNDRREVSTYNALYTGEKTGPNTYGPPFRDHIRHLDFTRLDTENSRAIIDAKLVWEMNNNQPVLDERRHLEVHALGKGEYLLDLTFTLIAAYGDVFFVSDAVHYAWPYLRLHPRFSGEKGGIITADRGATGQESTNMKVARWIDYSNTIEGVTEGLAVFQWPDGQDHLWLTREYGTFGPRRPDDQSGKSFTLKKGESISQRVGILIHRGDVKTGRVAERYKHYIESKWQ